MNRLGFWIGSLAIVLSGAVASADVPAVLAEQEMAFAISSHADHGGQIYYSCYAVEAAAEDLLTSLGAMNVKANCSGGLESGGFSPIAFLSLEFTHPVTAKATEATHSARYMTVELKGRESSSGVHKGHSCHLAREIFRNTSETLDLQNLHADFRCSGSFSRSYVIHADALSL